VEFLGGPVIVPRDRDMLFAVRHRNTDSIVVTIGRVADSLRAGLLRRPYYRYRQDSDARMERDSIVRVVAARAPVDSTATFVVPARWLPAAWRDEPVLLFRAWPRRPARGLAIDRSGYAVIRRTTLAAHVLRGSGTLDVLVTSLRDAPPVAGARVRFLERGQSELAAGVTDAQGRRRLTYSPPAANGWEEAALLEVSAHGERTLLALPAYGVRSRAPEDSSAGSGHYGRGSGGDLPDGRILHGVAFADRDIYRPGERVQLKGMVRTSRPGGEFSTPSGDSVRWTFSMMSADESAERIGRTESVLSEFGTSDTRFDVPRTGKLGTYAATLAYRAGD
jgi:uncharacterized protein YfaS (alpha-2-macroglobulin family)